MEVAEQLKDLGFLIGKLIQISDDLKDALEQPARPDWFRKWNNLAILYALTADYPERSRFADLLSSIALGIGGLPRGRGVEIYGPSGSGKTTLALHVLAEAQKILVRSGAVSFCAYQMVELHRSARNLLNSMTLETHEPLEELLEHHGKPLKSLFKSIGIESSNDLLA